MRTSGSILGLRERQDESRALAGFALESDPTTVSFGYLAGYGEAESGAFGGASFVRPVEPVEYERLLLLGDPDPRVRDLDLRPTVFLPRRYRHPAPGGGELHCVLQENRDG